MNNRHPLFGLRLGVSLACAIPLHASIPDETLVKGSGDAIYWVEDGKKHHVPNMQVFNSRGFEASDVQTVTDMDLNATPTGDDVTAAIASATSFTAGVTRVYDTSLTKGLHLGAPDIIY